MYTAKSLDCASETITTLLIGYIPIQGLPWGLSQSRICLKCRKPPAMQETWVQSLGGEDPLEKGKVTHSSFLTWRILRTVQSTGSQRVGHDSAIFTFSSQFQIVHFIVTGHLKWPYYWAALQNKKENYIVFFKEIQNTSSHRWPRKPPVTLLH